MMSATPLRLGGRSHPPIKAFKAFVGRGLVLIVLNLRDARRNHALIRVALDRHKDRTALSAHLRARASIDLDLSVIVAALLPLAEDFLVAERRIHRWCI
jgi:hypothetical protein